MTAMSGDMSYAVVVGITCHGMGQTLKSMGCKEHVARGKMGQVS